MTKPPASESSALTLSVGTVEKGRWSYHAPSGKWTVEYGDHKASSANPESLRSKLESWVVAGARKTPAAEVRMALLSLSSKGEMAVVKTHVALAEGAQGPRVVRFRREVGKEGWRSFQADSQVFVDPAHVEPALTKALVRLKAIGLVERLRSRTLAAMAADWMARQQDATTVVLASPKDPPELEVVERSDSRLGSRLSSSYDPTGYFLPPGVDVEPIGSDVDLSGWAQDKDGAWTLGSVRLALGVAHGRPGFRVEARMPGHDESQVIFASPNLGLALAAGRVTARLLDAGREPVEARLAGAERGADWWPAKTQVMGAVALSTPMLGRSGLEPQVLALERSLEAPGMVREDKAGWRWRAIPNARFGKSATWVQPDGASEKALGEIADLRGRVDREASQSEKQDVAQQASALWDEHSAQALERAVSRRMDEGEAEPGDLDASMAQWARLLAKWETQAMAHPDVVAEQQRLDQARARFDQALGNKPTPKRAGRAP